MILIHPSDFSRIKEEDENPNWSSNGYVDVIFSITPHNLMYSVEHMDDSIRLVTRYNMIIIRDIRRLFQSRLRNSVRSIYPQHTILKMKNFYMELSR